MMKMFFAAAAACASMSFPATAGTVVLTSSNGGALFQGTVQSTFPNTIFNFTASLVGATTGLPVSFSTQFVGEATSDNRYCNPLSNGPMGCGVFSPFNGPVESFTLLVPSDAFTYNLPVGFVGLRGALAFSPTSGATVTVNGPGSATVPEPATWTTMIAGFGLVGAIMRRRKAAVSFT